MNARNAKSLRILVVDPIDDDALRGLRARYAVTFSLQPNARKLLELIPYFDVLIMRSGVDLTASHIASAARLKLVVRAGVGTDNIDLCAASDANISVTNIAGPSARAVAEFAIGVLLCLVRRIVAADQGIRTNEWDKERFVGTDLHGRTLGIIGLGRIGLCTAELGRGLGMSVIGSVRQPTPARAAQLSDDGIELTDTNTVLRVADFVVLAVPLTGQTRALVGAVQLRAMKPTAYLVNVARGGVLDETALYEALTTGGIAGAGLDVFAHERQATPLAALDNVVLTPHIAAMTVDAQRQIGARLLEVLEAFRP